MLVDELPLPSQPSVSPLQAEPPEDSGARTYAKYSWQACMAVRDLLGLVGADIDEGVGTEDPSAPVRAIMCEWWEDWIVVNSDCHELVSAKHRDLDQGGWKLATLTDKGGLAHLYRNHRSLGGNIPSRIVSNQALLADQHGLGDLCQRSDDANGSPSIRPGADQGRMAAFAVARYLLHHSEAAGIDGDDTTGKAKNAQSCRPGESLHSKVEVFLAGLTLDLPLPSRSEIDEVAPQRYVRKILESLGHPPDADIEVWRHLVELMAQCMRGKGVSAWGGLTESVQHLRKTSDTGELPAPLQRRRFTSAQARTAIDHIAGRTRRRRPLPPAPSRTIAGLKMKAGGCRPTAIATAERHMSRWERARTEEVDDSPGQHAQVEAFEDELNLSLHDLEHEVTADASTNTPYGADSWQKATLIPVDQLPELPFTMDRKLMVGALATEINACRFWLSEEFDAHGELHAANEEYLAAQDGGAAQEGGTS